MENTLLNPRTLFGIGRRAEQTRTREPGTWVEQSAQGRLTANMMLVLDTGSLAPKAFDLASFAATPQIEVRLGLQSRASSPGLLDAWVDSHQEPELAQLARNHAASLTRDGLREVGQYLWLVMDLPKDYTPAILDSALNQLDAVREKVVAALQVKDKPATAGLTVAPSYEPPAAASCAGVHDAAAPTWTGYLQPDSLVHTAKHLVPELFQQTGLEFTVWFTCRALSLSELKMKRATLALGARNNAFELRQLAAAEGGTLVRCQYQLSLYNASLEQQHAVHAILRRYGLHFREPASGLLGWFATPKAFFATKQELPDCLPLQVLASTSTARPGTLLSTEANTPVVFDQFDGHYRRNMVVTGGPDSGMTYVAQSIVSSHVAAGRPAWGLGVAAGEKAPWLNKLGGSTQVLAMASSGLNPLAMCQNAGDLRVVATWLAALVTPYSVELDGFTRAKLEYALERAWARKDGVFCLDHVRRELEQMDAAGALLAKAFIPYTASGRYAKLLSGAPMDLKTDSLLMLDISAFSKDDQPLLLTTLLTMLTLEWQRMPHHIRKLAYVDPGVIAEMPTSGLSITHAAQLSGFLRHTATCNGAVLSQLPFMDSDMRQDRPIARALIEDASWQALMQLPAEALAWREDHYDADYSVELPLWRKANTNPVGRIKFVLTSRSAKPAMHSLRAIQLHQAIHSWPRS